MRYLSVCSGIEAATVAWHPLGWAAAAFSEIEAFPRAVLKHHYPAVPLHGDFTTIRGDEYGPVDLLVGGTPCQSFSVAGLRKGLDDERGNLALEYLRLAARLNARWLVWENVPGVLSSNGGRDFGAFLGGLAELGYGFAYRVLDAQFFGVPQRRRRVFVVGHLGDWRRAAAVLFERHSLSGHPAPRREAGEGAAGRAGIGAHGRGEAATVTSKWSKGTGGFSGAEHYNLLTAEVAFPITAREGKGPNSDCDSDNLIAHTLRADGFDASEDGTGRGTPLVPVTTPTLTSNGDAHSGFRDHAGLVPVAFSHQQGGDHTTSMNLSDVSPTLNCNQTPAVAFDWTAGSHQMVMGTEVSTTLRVGSGIGIPSPPAVQRGMAVRRITPMEAERLQGFPDDYTLVPYRGKPAADGPRYKALGNSMAVPVMRWIGDRIQMVEEIAASVDVGAAA